MERLKLGGHISIESDSGNIRVLDHNTITHLLEELVITIGLDRLVSKASPINAGKTYYQGAFGRDYQYRFYTDRDGKQLVTVYLLNLSSAEKAALSSDSFVLPVYSSDFMGLDSSKLVGYATARINPTAATKEGHIIPISGAMLGNNKQHGLSWRFEAGTVEGTFNTVAVGINVVDDNYCAGVGLSRSLDLKSILGGDNYNAYDYFIMPNVRSQDGTVVWTGTNEILLGGKDSSYYSVARSVLNLDTGVLTDLESSDPRYGLDLYNPAEQTQYVFGDWLLHGRVLPTYRSYNTVEAINIKTKETRTVFSSSYSVRGFFEYNGYLYICGQQTADDTFTALAYDSTLTAVSAQNITVTLPNSWTYSTCGIFPYGSNFLLEHGSTQDNKDPSNAQCLIFSDPTDIENSVIGVLPGIQPTCITFINGEPFFFDSGINNKDNYFEEGLSHQYAIGGGSTQAIGQNGLKFTTSGMFGNLLSFKVYNEDMTISAGDGVKVTYYYGFESE